MFRHTIFNLLIFSLAIDLTITMPACHSSPKGSSQSYHPVEKYLNSASNLHDLMQGKKIVFVSSFNGCRSCLELIKNFAQTVESQDIKFIYSIEQRRLVDMEMVELSQRKPYLIIMDYENKPFRKGLVTDNPIVYFLRDGLMMDSVQLTPRIFDETILKVRDYIY